MLLKIDDITVTKRLRQLNEGVVAELADSIQTIGLQNPISVASALAKRQGSADGISFELVAGLHRLSACKMLGWEEIEAVVLDLTPEQRELWEIDENLCRADLTTLERGEHLIRRKALYEEIYPQTKRGGDHRSLERLQTSLNAPLKSFRDDASEKVGISAGHLSRVMSTVSHIEPKIRNLIRDHPEIADNLSELRDLGKLEAPQQRKAVAMVETGQAGSVREARQMMEKPTGGGATRVVDVDPTQKRIDKAKNAVRALSREEQQMFSEWYDQYRSENDVTVFGNSSVIKLA